ncbi:MAG: hypothetical protein WC850_06370 [Candidatus Gracilibacteria bacterium]
MKQHINKILIGISLLFLLSSCDSVLSGIGNLMCNWAPDSDHCYQFTAVQSGSPSACEKIKGTKFKDTGSNPPRDKCYMTVAANKEDYTVCNKIKGGLMSYTPDECIKGVGKKILDETIKNDDLNGCKKLAKLPSGYQSDYEECKAKLATVDKIKGTDSKIDDLIGKLKSDPDNSDLKKQLALEKKQKQLTYEMMPDAQRGQYFKEKREEIMAGVEDEDVKSAISKEFTTYKSGEPNIINQLDKLQEITKKQELIKSADEKANELVDKMKEQLDGLVKDKQDAVIGAMGEKAEEWIQKNGGDDVKYALSNLKYSMDKYEKGSKMYEDAKGKYDKVKKVYDEVMGVYNRIDDVNKMLAEGKIDAGKAKVIKGAVLLDKGLEYATSYVPVFGSTISTVSKETFGVVIELAKKRAERSTALDKCFTDPANCDTDKISGY